MIFVGPEDTFPETFIGSDRNMIDGFFIHDELFGELRFLHHFDFHFILILKRKAKILCANFLTDFWIEALKEVFWPFRA